MQLNLDDALAWQIKREAQFRNNEAAPDHWYLCRYSGCYIASQRRLSCRAAGYNICQAGQGEAFD